MIIKFVEFYTKIYFIHIDSSKSSFEKASIDKKKWCKKYLKIDESRVYTVQRQDKKHFATDGRDGRGNVLIDDHQKNVKEWRDNGGIGVLHTLLMQKILLNN